MIQLLGIILIVIGIADFLLGNFAQINLTYFLGPISTFSPYIFGGIGYLFINYSGGSQSSNSDDPALDRFKQKKPKKKTKKKK